MKKLIAMALVALMAFAMLVPVSAAQVSADVLKGTPIVDGVLDDIYTQSASYELDTLGFYVWAGENEFDHSGKTYFLWDDNYLYVCAVINDNEILDIGAARYEENPVNWQSEAVENWFDEGNGKWKTHADAFGHTFFAQGTDGEPSFDYTTCPHAATVSDTYYTVEYAMPIQNLKVGGTFSMSMQVNDQCTLDDSVGEGYASGSQAADAAFTFSATEVTYPAVEEVAEEAPADEAAAPATEAAPAEAVTAAQTSDSAIAVIALMAIAGTGFVCTKKFLGK